MNTEPRNHDEDVHPFVSPWVQMNVGLWSLFAGATIFLALRLWCKITRRHGLWYDDYILIISWSILLANNSLIVYEFSTGYILEDSSKQWNDRMHILINISSCGTLIGQAWTKSAFGVTLIRMSNQWQRWILYFCIVTMNVYMIAKVVIQWAKVCGSKSYDNYWRLDFCLEKHFRNDFKEGGNVYNIIMDFVFACFPWLITRSLEMKRAEKIGLCVTMSLGMIVAIVSAIRVSWKDEGNMRDPWYIYRNGMSQVWYSSEVTGTIIVQCIPILRPILREIHTSLTSKRLESTADGRSTTFGSKLSSGKRISGGLMHNDKQGNERIALREIPEESGDDTPPHWKSGHGEFKPRPPTAPLPPSNLSSPYETEFKPRPPTSPLPPSKLSSPYDFEFKPRPPTSPLPPSNLTSPYGTEFKPRPPTSPLRSSNASSSSRRDSKPRPPTIPLPDLWPLSGNESPNLNSAGSGKSLDFDFDFAPNPPMDLEQGHVPQGLSPPPPRRFP